jgi:hypothetical protein
MLYFKHMKRVWLALACYVALIGASVAVNAPVVLADASGQCSDPSGLPSACNILVVKLNPAPAYVVNIQVTRKSTYLNSDNSFVLRRLDAGTYTSYAPISGTASRDPGCTATGSGGSADFAIFKIDVTDQNGHGTHGTSQINMCSNQPPSVDSHNSKTLAMAITSNTVAGTTGSISGTATYKDSLLNKSGPCYSGSYVTITGGPTNIQNVYTDKNGAFDTLRVLQPGNYTANLNCYDNPPGSGTLYTNGKSGIVVKANATTVIDFGNSLPANGGGAGVATGTTATGGALAAAAPSCDIGSFTWLVCPLISTVDSIITGLDKVVANQLQFQPLQNSSTNGLYLVWSSFRNLADVFFVLLFMFVIFGTALGLDSYTVKKMLPRLIAAAILIQFSWIIIGLAIDITNILGAGIANLVVLVPGAKNGNSATTQVFGVIETSGLLAVGVGAGIALAPELIVAALLTGLSLLVSLFVVFLTLQLRILLIQVMIILAPIAILAWVLPNTERYFKRWRSFLLDLLFMYPLIMIIFLAGTIFSVTAANSNGSDWSKIIGALGPLIAFFLVPATFKMAEGALSKGGDLIGKRTGASRASKGIGGLRDGVMKRRGEDRQKASVKKLDELNKTLGKDGKLGFGDRLRSRRALAAAGFGAEKSLESISRDPANAHRKARILGETAKVNAAEQAGFAHEFEQEQSAEIIKNAAMTSKNDNEVKAALAALGERQNTGALEEVLASDRFKGNTQDRLYQEGIKRSYSDLKAKAPHLVGDDNAYKDLSATQIGALDQRGRDRLDALTKEIDPATGQLSGRAVETAANLERVVKQLQTTPTLRAQIKGDAYKHLDAHSRSITGQSLDASTIVPRSTSHAVTSAATDIDHAAQLQSEIESGAPLASQVVRSVMNGTPLGDVTPKHEQASTVDLGQAPMAPAISKKALAQWSNDVPTLLQARSAYDLDPTYRDSVDQAVLRGDNKLPKPPPLPPTPRPLPLPPTPPPPPLPAPSPAPAPIPTPATPSGPPTPGPGYTRASSSNQTLTPIAPPQPSGTPTVTTTSAPASQTSSSSSSTVPSAAATRAAARRVATAATSTPTAATVTPQDTKVNLNIVPATSPAPTPTSTTGVYASSATTAPSSATQQASPAPSFSGSAQARASNIPTVDVPVSSQPVVPSTPAVVEASIEVPASPAQPEEPVAYYAEVPSVEVAPTEAVHGPTELPAAPVSAPLSKAIYQYVRNSLTVGKFGDSNYSAPDPATMDAAVKKMNDQLRDDPQARAVVNRFVRSGKQLPSDHPDIPKVGGIPNFGGAAGRSGFTRQRVSERLVDPRVEGEIDDHLV